MIKRTFILERGIPDKAGDRIILTGMKLPENHLTITNSFKPNLMPIGVGRVYLDNHMLKCEAELDESFVHFFPSVGVKPIKAVDNNLGGVDWAESELVSIALSPFPNMDEGIKRICDQMQIIKCSRNAEHCFNNCDHMDDRSKCPHAKIDSNG